MDKYTLDELAAQSGFDRRVIRSFIEQGLMRGPDTLGRYARYTQAHLLRLQAIKELKETKGMQLAEIRQALMVMSESELRSLTGRPADASPAPAADSAAGMSAKTALDYIRTINYKIDEPAVESHEKVDLSALFQFQLGPSNEYNGELKNSFFDLPHPPQPNNQSRDESHTAGATPIEQLLRELEKIVGPARIRKQSKSESWHRIAITPDLEFSVRGINDPEQLARLERIADCLRELLMGGASS